MLKILLRDIKKLYREIKVLLSPHPLFRVIDKIKLSKIKKDTDEKGFIFLKPKGFRHNIKIRRNYVDREVIHYVLQDQYHLPPKSSKISRTPVILDLGSNIGLTIVHMKHIYPNAKIIGYEMNKENFLLAKRNTKFFDDVIVNNKAVWFENKVVFYKINSCHDAYSVIDNKELSENKQEKVEVQSTTIPNIIEEYNLNYVDYLKMDIEGAEEAILNSDDLSWLNIIHSMNIEMHLDDNEKIFDYIKIIESKGFKAWKDDKHWSSIFAVKLT